MKIKQKLLFLLPLLFLFTPLFSSAQFITTNAPCEPEIIPPLGQVEGVYCPYCPNKGEYLHLKWDLKANFQDPVCGIECWGPSGDQCYNWSSAEQWFDENGRSKTKLKPKDDVFIKRPPTSPRSAVPGTNLQVHCWEKNDASDPSKKKTSAGIRVYSDNACGEPAVGEPCEVPFMEIVNNLRVGLPAKITEANFKNWSTGPDLKDNSILSKGLGSGDKADVVKSMIDVQICQRLPEDKDVYRYAEYDRLTAEIKSSLDNHIPLVIVILAPSFSHAVVALKYSQNVSTTINGKQELRDLLTVFDPNFPGEFVVFSCKKERVFNLLRYYDILRCNYNRSGAPEYSNFFVIRNPVQMYEPLDCGITKRVRSKPTDWLMSSNLNLPNFDNFAPGDGRLYGICFGYSDFVRNVACFGDFVGYDYHPDDGKIVGRDCGIDRYPIAKSVSRNSSLLSNIFSVLSKYILD